MKKILVTGGKGVLAQYLNNIYKRYKIFSPGHLEFDVTNRGAVETFFKKNRPDITFHLAAKTNVDECEKNPKEAFRVNAGGTKNIAKAAKKYNSFLVYVSSAAVFDGTKKYFLEDDEKNPINIYGASKLEGEMYVEDILDNFLIVRAAWLIGGGRKEKKFISYIVKKASETDKIEVVKDKFGTITYAKELAFFIKNMLKDKKIGIYHFGSRGAVSRFDIAKKVVRLLGKKVKLVPVSSSYFSQTFSAPRPQREVIKSRKIKFPFSWRQSLENYFLEEIIRS